MYFAGTSWRTRSTTSTRSTSSTRSTAAPPGTTRTLTPPQSQRKGDLSTSIVDADPDPAFYLNADPGSGSWSNFTVTKSWKSTWKIYLKLVIGQKSRTVPTKVQNCSKGRKPGFFVKIAQLQCSWFWISIPHTDSDPEEANHCGSILIRIQPDPAYRENTSGGQ